MSFCAFFVGIDLEEYELRRVRIVLKDIEADIFRFFSRAIVIFYARRTERLDAIGLHIDEYKSCCHYVFLR